MKRSHCLPSVTSTHAQDLWAFYIPQLATRSIVSPSLLPLFDFTLISKNIQTSPVHLTAYSLTVSCFNTEQSSAD